MTKDQLKTANKLEKEKNEIERELGIWKNDLNAPSQLAYCQSWNNNHATELETHMPSEIFSGFRTSVMNALELRLREIKEEFNSL